MIFHKKIIINLIANSDKLKRYYNNNDGAIAPIFALLIIPLLLAMMVAVDTANLMGVRSNVQSALDAATLAVGKRYSFGSSEIEISDFGTKIFNANLRAIEAKNTKFKLLFPVKKSTDQRIFANAEFTYISFFGRIANNLSNNSVDWDQYTYNISSTIRLSNTIEVALVMDNSGSMEQIGLGTFRRRIDVIKSATSQLVNNLADRGQQMMHLNKPVQVSVVPFAASVNVGTNNRDEPWMDTQGLSPIHYENFSMPTQNTPIIIASDKKIILKGDRYIKDGAGWGAENSKPFSRFSLYRDMKLKNGKPYTSWRGCVETRSGVYGINAAAPSLNNSETLYVPMFAPDEADFKLFVTNSVNDWWPDNSGLKDYVAKQKDISRYYKNTASATEATPADRSVGPSYSCTSTAITPLTDVTSSNGRQKVLAAIKAMLPLGGTNIPEGMVWGWRSLIKGAPFKDGRVSSDLTNDKVVIVLTDGFSTYYTYKTIVNPDVANNISIYGSLGYTSTITKGYNKSRIFQETTGVDNNHTNENYTEALNSRLKKLCELAKKDKIIVMTVALDLSVFDARANQDALKDCASESRVRKDPSNPKNAAKLYWNTKSDKLDQTFKEIADELSTLRVVK